MASVTHTYDANGVCVSCPMEGNCHECGKPCTDHDLVACWYWCTACLDASVGAYEARLQAEQKGTA